MILGTTTPLKEQTISYPFKKTTYSFLVKYLFLVHERKNLKPHRPFVQYLPEMKKFAQEVGEEDVKLLILRASETINYPFGVKFLRRLHAEEVKNNDSTE